MQRPLIITITGPSASGKTVLSKMLVDGGMETLVSTTTRMPREGEIDGVDYHFISEGEFEKGVKDGVFIENIKYNGVMYGIYASEVEKVFKKSKPAVVVAEPQGVKQINDFSKNMGWPVFKVFVDNPENKLLGRLLNRLIDDTKNLTQVNPLADEDLSKLTTHANELNNILNDDDEHKEENIQAYLTKFIEDYTNTIPNEDEFNKKIKAAASRLKSFHFEQKNWVEPARQNPDSYEFITDEFNQEVQEKVFNEIVDKTQKHANNYHLQINKNQNKVKIR